MMVLSAWVLSLVFSIPQLFIFSLEETEPGQYNCWATFHPEWTLQFYVTWTSVAIYIVPSIMLTITYGRICFKVWKSSKYKESSRAVYKDGKRKNSGYAKMLENGIANQQSHFQKLLTAGDRVTYSHENVNPRAHVVRGMTRSKVKTVKLTLTVIICYLLCWSPFFISQLWAAWDYNAPFQGQFSIKIIFLHFKMSLRICIGPFQSLSAVVSRPTHPVFESKACLVLLKNSLQDSAQIVW